MAQAGIVAGAVAPALAVTHVIVVKHRLDPARGHGVLPAIGVHTVGYGAVGQENRFGPARPCEIPAAVEWDLDGWGGLCSPVRALS